MPWWMKWRRLAGGRAAASSNVEGGSSGGEERARLRLAGALAGGAGLVTGCCVLHDWRCLKSWLRDGKAVLQRVQRDGAPTVNFGRRALLGSALSLRAGAVAVCVAIGWVHCAGAVGCVMREGRSTGVLAVAAVADAGGSRSGAAGDGVEWAGGCEGGAPRPETSSMLLWLLVCMRGLTPGLTCNQETPSHAEREQKICTTYRHACR